MKNQKMYEPEDKVIGIIQDNYDILQILGSFGINLGFGNKTVKEVCEQQHVDTYTFLTVVNFTVNGFYDIDEPLSVPTLMQYLRASHAYYIDFQLPFIRKELVSALDENDSLAHLILRLYDEYSHEIISHMRYEEKTVFPYVQELLDGKTPFSYNIETFSKHHSQKNRNLRELKNIIIKYLPSDGLHNNQLSATLYDIYNLETWLNQHARVEDNIFIPAIRSLEEKNKQNNVSTKISKMVQASDETLSDRERDVLVSLAQGLSNKQIAEDLSISINTVITHRRNIARKLQIHSPAGLTIYAIVNNLVDISSVKM